MQAAASATLQIPGTRHANPSLFFAFTNRPKMESYEPPKNAYKALNFWLASGGPSPQRRTGKVPLSLLRHEEE